MNNLYRWILKNKKVDYKSMSAQLNLSQEVCRIMVNRDITTKDKIQEYLDPNLDRLHDPMLMQDMDKAVNIITQGISLEKSIRIVSDYDVDGVVSCTVLYKALKRCGAKVDYIIPDRKIDGYGINERIVQEAKNQGIQIIITCDNGISAFSAIKYAKKLGITVIVTDHHQVNFYIENSAKVYTLPEADAILNPKQSTCKYPYKELCGAGVVFKLVQALYRKVNIPDSEAFDFIEYISLATICDIVDLNGENRIIAKNGLEMLNRSNNLGINALIKKNNLQNKLITTYAVGFVLGPCINAVGRLDNCDKAVELLLTVDENKAEALASEIYDLNMKRRELTEDGFCKVLNSIEDSPVKDDKVKIIYSEEVNESVAGIIAGRVKDRYYLPAIVLTDSLGGAKGSGRSIESYNIYEELSNCSDLLVKFGGHSLAAGLSIEKSNIEPLRRRLNDSFTVEDKDLIPILNIDAFLPIDKVTIPLVDELVHLEPYGKGNAKPTFGDRNVAVAKAKVLGKNRNVLSLKLVSNSNQFVQAIYFGDIDSFNSLIVKKHGESQLEKMYNGVNNSVKVDIAYFPKINEYNGNVSIQIHISHFR